MLVHFFVKLHLTAYRAKRALAWEYSIAKYVAVAVSGMLLFWNCFKIYLLRLAAWQYGGVGKQ